ncbi:integral membrane sensor signal transduction histidine kinase [Solidesulfovibrio fructosivorans JJ]]|uniref:histidine kinase n=1 Tax=Solidesulfovibrio fructosivorans JJ] TaxID=596151 RepID=E1JS79_SOLFR|nr:PAS domain-containing sensor histidine kinase [Solidesulfovibrio fructosivorans]EFL52848.1 integral membrane sensor signal transduction histidine kinase [Solidesulfovibrio fructosivorans JJ]]
MGIFRRLRPQFWDGAADAGGPYRSLFNYRRLWWLSVALLTAVSLTPLCIMTVIDFGVTKRAVTQENLHRTTITTSNTRRTLTYFVDERLAALNFAAREEAYASLAMPGRLAELLKDLKAAFGGFMDLGVIDDTGKQIAYVGPYDLLGIDYSKEPWFTATAATGHYISDIFLGFRNVPHMVIAVRASRPDGGFFVLRATVDTQRINDILANLDLSGGGDAFLINHQGVLQTMSRSHGAVFEHLRLPVPSPSERTEVFETETAESGLIVGYAYIDRTPLILMVVKRQAELMKSWYAMRLDLFGFLAASMLVILVVIVGVATYMVEKIHAADQTRAKTLQQMEHTNRMASIGRLAAGVAHEINNPLAIINEKAGLMQDLLRYAKEPPSPERLAGLIDSILGSVERAGTITKRLLSFARHQEVHVAGVSLRKTAEEVLSFLTKEAEYRRIKVEVEAAADVPDIESDQGKLQQILLNLVNNAFQAMDDGGHLCLRVFAPNPESVAVSVSDNGCGIPAADVKRIFEPFYSTKKKKGGTGLGLSITYGLVQELGGTLAVESELGHGSTFTVTFPLSKGDADNAHTARG